MATMPVTPGGMPICPKELSPQPTTLPSARKARLCAPPTATLVTLPSVLGGRTSTHTMPLKTSVTPQPSTVVDDGGGTVTASAAVWLVTLEKLLLTTTE